jgi:hypothetical protein
VGLIEFPHMFYRRDIGDKALQPVASV